MFEGNLFILQIKFLKASMCLLDNVRRAPQRYCCKQFQPSIKQLSFPHACLHLSFVVHSEVLHLIEKGFIIFKRPLSVKVKVHCFLL